MIPFTKPFSDSLELTYIKEAIDSKKLCGNGAFCQRVQDFFNANFNFKPLLMPSATAALEMMALLLDIKDGDEVIAPSFTFVSSVNAFVLRGAKICFVDINPKTMNLDENLLQSAITNKTKAIVPVHYAGVACEMDFILDIARSKNIAICEDAAQGVNAFYHNKPLGTLGDFGAFSFHETKNFTSGGEGGALFASEKYRTRAEILQEKGTNRQLFFRGMVDKYSWVDIGSSYLMPEINAAFLLAQLQKLDLITKRRLEIWQSYFNALKPLEEQEKLELPFIPKHCTHNGHIFYIKLKDLAQREALISFLKQNEVQATFHYVPLHSSKAGQKYGKFIGSDIYTTKESERLLRLPLFYDLTNAEQEKIISLIFDFFKGAK